MTDTQSRLQSLSSRIIAHADRLSPEDYVHIEVIEGVGVMRARSPKPLENILLTPMMCLVLQGEKTTSFGDRSVNYGAGEVLIVSISTPAVSQVIQASTSKPYAVIAMEIDFNIVKSLASEIELKLQPSEQESQSISAGQCVPELIDAIDRLFSLTEEDEMSRKILAPLIKREIHFRLLSEGHAGMLRSLSRPNSQASHINKVLINLNTNFAEDIAVAELADIAGMSISGFHTHFKAFTGTTPLQYQKDLRLLKAKDRLINSSASVSSVAFDVGYDSVSQFSREYHRKFGASPSRDRQLPD